MADGTMFVTFFRDIGAIMAAIISFITLTALVVKPIRKGVIAWIRKMAGSDVTTKNIYDLTQSVDRVISMLEKHIETNAEEADYMRTMLVDQNVGMQSLFRNTIMRIYYTHLPKKTLPIYERKNLILMYSLYSETFHGNTYAKDVYNQMLEWPVDYDNGSEP